MKIRLFLLLLLSWFTGFSQELRFSLETGIIDAIETDAIGNVYAVAQGGEVLKFNRNLELIGNYSSNTLVEINRISVNQEQKVLIFSKPLQKAEILDRFLNKVVSLDLSISSDGYFTEVLLGNHGGLWLFNSEKLTLIRTPKMDLNDGLETEFSFLTADIINIKDCGSQLITQSDDQLFVFDNLGQFLSTVELKSNSFDCDRNQIYSIVNNDFVSLHRETSSWIRIYEDFNYKDYSVAAEWVYVIQDKEIIRYKLTK